MSRVASPSRTLCDAVTDHLRACETTADGIAPPAVILWTDAKGEWRPVVELLKERMPQLFELGAYEPEQRRGPAIWLRTVIEPTVRAGKLPELDCIDRTFRLIGEDGAGLGEWEGKRDPAPTFSSRPEHTGVLS